MPARLDEPLCLTGAVKTANTQIRGGLSLQSLLQMSLVQMSLLQMSHGTAHSKRGGQAMPFETIGAL
jgi:hypothetical protein